MKRILTIALLLVSALGPCGTLVAQGFDPNRSYSDCIEQEDTRERRDFCNIYINGEIRAGLLQEVQKWLRNAGNLPGVRYVKVWLNSPGGSIAEALEVGRELRENDVWALVAEGSQCSSACVLLLAGGAFRAVEGSVGIHRPYFESNPGSVADARVAYNKLSNKIREFLIEGSVRADLYDQMLSTPPESIRMLTGREKWDSGLARNDPAADEALIHDAMARLGIDRNEYNRRELLVREYCLGMLDNSLNNYYQCAASVRENGVSSHGR